MIYSPIQSPLRSPLQPLIGGVRRGGAAAAGYDILLPYGQSNVFYGSQKDPLVDIADPDIYQWGYNAPNANTIFAANDPLDYFDVSGVNGALGNNGAGDCIGHVMTFARTTYKPTYAAGRKILLAGAACGGQALSNGGTLSPNHPGIHYTSLITRALAAQTAGADASTFKLVMFHQGEGDYQAFAAVAQPGIVRAYRACLTHLVDKIRADLSAPELAFLLGQMTVWSVDAASARFSTNGINIDKIHRELVNRVDLTAFAGNGGDGAGDVHYTDDEQRNLAGRHAASYIAALANTRPACTWPTIDVPAAGFVVSGANMDISGDGTSAWKSAFATGGRKGELVYMEFEAVAVASQTNLGFCGLANCFQTDGNYLGQVSGNLSAAGNNSTMKAAGVYGGQPNSATGWTVANAVSIGTITAGTRIRIALNGATGKAWIGKVGSAWPASGDPEAGTNPWITGIGTTERVFPAVSIYTGAGNTWRLHVNTGDFTGVVPTGFSAWGT